MFLGDEGTQKNGTNRYSVPPCRQKWQQKGRTVWQCCMPHATWLFVSDAVPRVPVFAFSLSLLFSVYFLLSFPVFISGAVPRSLIPRHTSCVLHLISCPRRTYASPLGFVFRFCFVLRTARTTPPVFVSRCCVSRLALRVPCFVFHALCSVPRTPYPVSHFPSLTRLCASPPALVFRCRVSHPAPHTP